VTGTHLTFKLAISGQVGGLNKPL